MVIIRDRLRVQVRIPARRERRLIGRLRQIRQFCVRINDLGHRRLQIHLGLLAAKVLLDHRQAVLQRPDDVHRLVCRLLFQDDAQPRQRFAVHACVFEKVTDQLAALASR